LPGEVARPYDARWIGAPPGPGGRPELLPPPGPIAHLAVPVASALLLFGAAHLLGERLVRLLRLDLEHPLERVAIPGALGLTALGLAGMALGLAGGFRPPWILVLLAVPVLGARIGPRPDPVRPRWEPGDPGRALRAIAWIAAGVLALSHAVRALYPPTGFDALNYQLPAVARHLEAGSLVYPVDLRFAAGPGLIQVLFVLAASTGGDLAAQLVSFGTGLLAAAAVGGLAGRAFGHTAGAAAAAIFYATPIVGWLSAQAYVDLGGALFATVALHGVVVRLAGGALGWAAAAGIAAGGAMGVRYLAVVPLAILTLDLLSAPADGPGAGIGRRAQATALFVGVAAGLAAPWYVRNLRETGNPVFPLFNDLLGGLYWSAEDVHEHQAWLAAIGPGRGPLDLLLLPARLTFDPAAFGASTGTGIGFAYLLTVPAALVLARRFRAGPTLALFAGGYGAVWFATSQQPRFLLPALGALAALGGMAVQEVAARRVAVRRPLAAALILSVGLFGIGWGAPLPSAAPPTGASARQEFLRQRLPAYAVVQEVNGVVRGDEVVYAFGFEGLRYHFRPRVIGDWFGPTAYRRFLAGDDAARAAWRRLGVTHVLIRDDVPSRAVRGFRERPYWWDRLVPLGRWGDAHLYRLVEPPPPPGRRGALPPTDGREAVVAALDTPSGRPLQ
jgi:hypothetical protein